MKALGRAAISIVTGPIVVLSATLCAGGLAAFSPSFSVFISTQDNVTARSGELAGRALDGDGTKSLSAVTIELSTSGSVVARTVSAADGSYTFSGLAAGAYMVVAHRTGYATGAYGRAWPEADGSVLELGSSERLKAIDVRLWKLASVSGTIVDQADDPLVGVEVAILRATSGHDRLTLIDSATTDDRGEYRIGALVPGDYLVAVPATRVTFPHEVAQSLSEGWQVAGAVVQQANSLPQRFAASDGGSRVYATTFFPGVSSIADASALNLNAGDARSVVDIKVVSQPAWSLSGTLAGPDASPVAWTLLRLLPKTVSRLGRESSFEAALTVSDARGAFAFHDVTAGEYVIRVLKVADRFSLRGPFLLEYVFTLLQPSTLGTQPPPARPSGRPPAAPTLCAAEPVTISDHNVSVDIRLVEAPRVTGRLEFDGKTQRPGPAQLRRMFVALEPADGSSIGGAINGALMPAWASEEGTFETYGAFPGSYVVKPGGELLGWVPKAASYAGKNALDSPVVLSNGGIRDLAVSFTDRPASLGGFVTTDRGEPDSAAFVLVFPVDVRQWKEFGRVSRRLLSARASRKGRYLIADVPAGEYYIIAVPIASARNWQHPEFLSRLVSTATRVQVIEGQTVMQDLRPVIVSRSGG